MIRRYSIRVLPILALIFAGYSLSFAQATAISAVSAAPEFSQVRLEAFDKVWNTVNEQHYDPTFGGVDWKAVRETYLPKAKAAVSDADFHGVLRQMLGELKLSHFNVFPPEPSVGTGSDRDGSVGIQVTWLDGLSVVSRVDKGSSAENAGVKTGFVISKIDGKSVLETLKSFREALAKRPATEAMRRVYVERAVDGLLSGKPDSTVKIEFLDGEDQPHTADLIRLKYNGEMSQPLGNFPKQKVLFESRLLPENIAYIRFNMWVVPQAAKIRVAMKEFAKADAIIVDLRGNPGGVGGLAGGAAGLMTDKRLSLGSMNSRAGTMNVVGFPQPEPFLGKVIVLTDHGTGSTSELFAAGMQEAKRARIVGDVSAGAVLPSVFEKLPTGYMFQYAVSDYRTPNNVLVEGRGVQPDIKVLQTRRSLLAGRDVQLEAAIADALGKQAPE